MHQKLNLHPVVRVKLGNRGIRSYVWNPTRWGNTDNWMGRGRKQSVKRTELEALVWAMQCMLAHNKRRMNFQTDCTDLVKMVSTPREWPAFENLLDEVEQCKRKFQAFSLTHIPRTNNTKADKLARSARDQPYNVCYINSVPPVSIPEPL
ncbi:unnamed protein product [Microthlaspi erraticum]|uniref:RNase H type-1 domain-containing protein n=1 Tax=Microthlaspi erraticum TaxID=1685480 RepID=A0A6D2JZZ2_9BRAS|nr:unnamed protein product [Microthlaspi erraticum]